MSGGRRILWGSFLSPIVFSGINFKLVYKNHLGLPFGTRPIKCPRCKKHCSRKPKRYESMPPKKFSKIQNDFFDTVFMSKFLFVF